ncbi:hypothetical protein PybrP1_009955 [[Pythium] brassicae (nom. inval.)]|nr:hypothetical protein PybrP1_009955 [[Pythium] brassicae (nom. inval.)]
MSNMAGDSFVVVMAPRATVSAQQKHSTLIPAASAASGARTYAVLACTFASLGGLFFGYDQGVTGGVLVMNSFLDDWCVGWHGQTYDACRAAAAALPARWLDYTLWYNMTYNVGCIAGALVGGWVADAFGRRVTIFTAGLLFCVGTSWIAREGGDGGDDLLLQPAMLQRVAIAMGLQVLQQATGINPMFAYGGLIFKDVAGDGVRAVLLLSVVNFLGTVPAMRWVDTCGRRQLLLLGAVGMVLGHAVAGAAFVLGCSGGGGDGSSCSAGAATGVLAGTAVFVAHFAVSWGPVCWIYPAEIFPLRVRAKAVALSTMANWVMGSAMASAVKLFPALDVSGVFFVFGALCAVAGTFVYFLCPETKGLLLEDIDALFTSGTTGSSKASTYEKVGTQAV